MEKHKLATHLDDFKLLPRLVTVFVLFMWWQVNTWFTKDWSLDPLTLEDWLLVQFAAINATFIGFSKLFMEAWKKE